MPIKVSFYSEDACSCVFNGSCNDCCMFLRLYDGTMDVPMVVLLKGGCCCLKIYVTVPITFEKVEVIEDDVIWVNLDTSTLHEMNWLSKNQVKSSVMVINFCLWKEMKD